MNPIIPMLSDEEVAAFARIFGNIRTAFETTIVPSFLPVVVTWQTDVLDKHLTVLREANRHAADKRRKWRTKASVVRG